MYAKTPSSCPAKAAGCSVPLARQSHTHLALDSSSRRVREEGGWASRRSKLSFRDCGSLRNRAGRRGKHALCLLLRHHVDEGCVVDTVGGEKVLIAHRHSVEEEGGFERLQVVQRLGVSVIERGCQALLFEFLDGQIAVDFQNAPRLVMLDDESEIRIDVALSHGERRLLTLQQAQKPLRRKNGFPAVIHHRVFSVRQSQSPILLVVMPNGSYGD